MHLDLNLLVTFDALLEEGSVAGAADRLHLSAPAMSRALGRLRKATGDEILVRTGRTMTPTPRAVALRERVHDLVQQAEDVLAPQRGLDLATLDRTFTLRWHDALVTAAGPRLLAHVLTAAPGVRLRFLTESGSDADELRAGRVDLEVNSGPRDAPPDVRSEVVARDAVVVVLPEARPLSLADYLAHRHVIVSRRGRLRDALDDVLDTFGEEREVVAAVPTATAALLLVREAGVLSTGVAGTTTPLAHDLGLAVAELPFEVPEVPVVVSWHQRYQADPAHTWLRRVVAGILRELSPPAVPTGAG